jgi:hypothetical protein
MAQGWKFRTKRPNPKGGPDLQGMIVVRVADQLGARLVAADKLPDATISAEFLEQYDIKPGQTLILIEGY